MAKDIVCFRANPLQGGIVEALNGHEVYNAYAILAGAPVSSGVNQQVSVDSERWANPNYTLENGGVRIADAGRYAIHGQVNLQGSGSNSRSQFECDIFINGAIIAGSNIELYVRQTNFGATGAASVLVDVPADSFVEIMARRTAGTGNGVPQPSGVRLVIQSADDFIRTQVQWDDVVGVPYCEPNGIAPLDASGKVPTDKIPASVINGLQFLGGWDADANNPVITSGTHSGVNGDFYVVNVAGTTNIDGEDDWQQGDAIVWSESESRWVKIGDVGAVDSVNGQTGVVVLEAVNIPADDGSVNPILFPAFTNVQEFIDSVNSAGITLLDSLTQLQQTVDSIATPVAFKASEDTAALTTDGTTQSLALGTTEYVDDEFTWDGTTLTFLGGDKRFSIKWALVFDVTSIPLLSGLENATAGVVVNGTDLITVDTFQAGLSVTNQPTVLSGSVDVVLQQDDALTLNYNIASVAGLITAILGGFGGALGSTSQPVTHLSVHAIQGDA